ncbi:hypothetical protein [Microbacterium murale]|uniref:Uncharacterized protein n=1 Tax=Microbacterium murale TaxID=1081040 RepID=A0ABU0P3M1_9MICO|nr:hypothetical protein [Microbacterium murale]MDQ0641940.1 hypothetical protein [Microbacterium murale]
MSTESPLANEPEPSSDQAALSDQSPLDDQEPFAEDDGVLYDEEVTPQPGIVGFTLRELLIVGVWFVAFVTSFFPVHAYDGAASLWAQGIQWVLALGLPTAAVFLIVLRRFSPEGIRRVGSLGIDQFASVAFSVSALYWATGNWDLMLVTASTGEFALTWLTIVQFIAALALVVLTVFAPLIPRLRDDFHGRLVTLAHRNANPVRPVIARPRVEKPAPPAHASPAIDTELSGENTTDEIARLGLDDRVSSSSHASSGDLSAQRGFGADIGLGTTVGADESDYVPAYARTSRAQFDADDEQDVVAADAVDEIEVADSAADGRTEVIEDLDATAPRNVAVSSETAAEPSADAAPAVASQPFWALAPTERDVFDERGEPLFRIGPSAWALVVEDRGGAYVVRHDDGRIGYLHDIADITKG